MASLVADSLGATRMPWSRSTRHVPTVRRSCQPMPGPTGSPGGAVPHDGRGPLVGDADPRDRAAGVEGGGRHLEHGRGHGGGVELDEARAPGTAGSTST